MIDLADAPSIADQHHDRLPLQADPYIVARVMELWDQGKDTADMAVILFNDRKLEHRCCVALRSGLEQRREQRRSGG